MKQFLIRIGILSLLIFATSCNFDTSKKQKFDNEITTAGEGLSAANIYVETKDGQLADNTFVFAQKMVTNFENMDGFTVEDDRYYPQMKITVTDQNDSIIMQSDNLFNEQKGLDVSLKTIYGELILANPFESGKRYTAVYKIVDTRGDGVLTSTMNFDVMPNPNITVKESGIKAKEVYVFNSDTNEVIADDEVKFSENLQFQFEGLQGYTQKNGLISLGLSVKVTDATGHKLVENIDAFDNTLLTQLQVDQGIGGTLVLTKGVLKNPITWDVKIWDRNGDSSITATTTLEVN